MDTSGQYSDTPTSTTSAQASYGSVVSSADTNLQLDLTGMSYDSTKADSQTITSSDQILKIYYKRSQYAITYSYTKPDATKVTNSVQYYYGATVDNYAKPSIDGYTFNGWTYGESGTKPDTMPAKNISATGSFEAKTTTYKINYYTRNLASDGISLADTYTLNSTETKSAKHDDSITLNATDAKDIEGFTATYVSVSTNAPGGATRTTTDTSATGKVSAITDQTMELNVYYERNQYTLTLNVVKENADNTTTTMYTTGSTLKLYYGATIDSTYYLNYDHDNWNKGNYDLSQYTLLSEYFAEWSTGTEAPSTMPAGNVTATRKYALYTLSDYEVNVYVENQSGGYDLKNTLSHYGTIGSSVTIGSESTNTLTYDTIAKELGVQYSQ